MSSDEAAVVAATVGDQSAFALITERHRRELLVHCYRMLGSFDEAEDVVQETFLRAWRSREGFSYRGPSSFRAWLYRVATNAYFDALRDRRRQPFPWQLHPEDDRYRGVLATPEADLAWLQPFPDRVLHAVAPRDEERSSRSSRGKRSSWPSSSRFSCCRRHSARS